MRAIGVSHTACKDEFRRNLRSHSWSVFSFFIVYIRMCLFLTKQYDPSHYEKTHPHSILQVPTTQLAKMSIDPKFVELTADVLEIFLKNTNDTGAHASGRAGQHFYKLRCGCPIWHSLNFKVIMPRV